MTIEKTKFNMNFGTNSFLPDMSLSGGTSTNTDIPPLMNFSNTGFSPMGGGFTMPDINLGLGLFPSMEYSMEASLGSVAAILSNMKLPDFSQLVANIPSVQNYSNILNSQIPDYAQNFMNNTRRMTGNMGKDIVSTAQQYMGFNEKDGSYKMFTNGRKEAWCADFVTYVVKEAYKKNGKTLPSGFGSPSVSTLKKWGEDNNCYLSIRGRSDKGQYIAQNVKSGDIVIFKENGRSHTGIVKEVKSDGTIVTVEGNTSDKVACRTYSPGSGGISGFIQMA